MAEDNAVKDIDITPETLDAAKKLLSKDINLLRARMTP